MRVAPPKKSGRCVALRGIIADYLPEWAKSCIFVNCELI